MQTKRQQREWLAPKEVANELRVHVSAIYRAVERGELPALRLSESGAIRIHRSALNLKRAQSDP
jgi:excisionase family DNA binding protein